METLKLVITTFAEEDAAVEMANKLLSANLAACCNILPGVKSFYKWDGKLVDDEEIMLIVKTRDLLVKDVIRAIEADHTYDLSAIEVVAVETQNEGFFEWVRDETKN